jgi:hypothetical protein
LKVFENRVLRRIFGPKREKVAGGWRRLHNEVLVRFTKYYEGDQIENEMGDSCSKHGRDKKSQEDLKGGDHLEDIGINGRITSEWFLVSIVRGCGLD